MPRVREKKPTPTPPPVIVSEEDMETFISSME